MMYGQGLIDAVQQKVIEGQCPGYLCTVRRAGDRHLVLLRHPYVASVQVWEVNVAPCLAHNSPLVLTFFPDYGKVVLVWQVKLQGYPVGVRVKQCIQIVACTFQQLLGSIRSSNPNSRCCI